MNIPRFLAATSICMFLSSTSWAIDKDEHTAHHPDAVAHSSKATKVDGKEVAKNDPQMNKTMAQESMMKMDSQMKMMNEMHQKMMNAKTPDERKVLMAEHMRAMQGGMTMMGDMSKTRVMSTMDNMPNETITKGDAKEKMNDGMKCDMGADMAIHHQMMEKRMQMMETMMQMMMDRMTP